MGAVRVRALIVALILALAPFEGTAAQDFPSRPVRFVVPYAAGGSGDLLARLLGNKLASIWGQQVVVDNRPGAGGLIGTEFAAHSEPDGYTLYLGTDGPLTIAATLYKRVPYDWKRDFAPVSMLAMGYQVLLVGRSLAAQNVQELIALARQKPGELNYASIGIGSAPHLGAELFKSVAKVDITHVPYRGSSAQAITALIAGDVSMFLVGTSRGARARRHAGANRQEARRRHCASRRRSRVQERFGSARLRGSIERARAIGGFLGQGLRQVSRSHPAARPAAGMTWRGAVRRHMPDMRGPAGDADSGP